MIVKHLGHTDFNSIMDCFLKAFENYFVKMPTDYNYYKQRWKAAKVRYDLSYGMFDNEKLVGFIINAVAKRNNDTIAFNTGTGVIPEYRGQRIVKSIYDVAIPELKKNGITKCALEVITENEKAIKSYESIGFNICKNYRCFSGELTTIENKLVLKQIRYKEIDWATIPNQKMYSWDNNYSSLEAGNFSYFKAFKEDKEHSFFAINEDNGYVAQLEVFDDKVEHWNALLASIRTRTDTIKINNVDERLENKRRALEISGLKNTVNQYEMELYLTHEA